VQLLFDKNGHVEGRATVAKNGTYAVTLPPGIYTVAVSPSSSIGRGIEPNSLTVNMGSDKVDFQIDTGIR
jgi:hypothetical protein